MIKNLRKCTFHIPRKYATVKGLNNSTLYSAICHPCNLPSCWNIETRRGEMLVRRAISSGIFLRSVKAVERADRRCLQVFMECIRRVADAVRECEAEGTGRNNLVRVLVARISLSIFCECNTHPACVLPTACRVSFRSYNRDSSSLM